MGCGASAAAAPQQSTTTPTPSDEAIANWEALGGKDVEAVLESGAVALLDAAWLVAQME
jgi:hypothetical protein